MPWYIQAQDMIIFEVNGRQRAHCLALGEINTTVRSIKGRQKSPDPLQYSDINYEENCELFMQRGTIA